MTCRSNRLAMRKHLTIASLVALANIPLAYAQEGLTHKNNPFEFPVTISKCQPSTVDNKHDPNPAVRVDIAVDNRGFTVAHHMANGVTYIRGEQYAVRAFQIDKSDPNLAIWIGLRRNDPDIVMVGYLQYVPSHNRVRLASSFGLFLIGPRIIMCLSAEMRMGR
jgi:hypothetical protein